MVLRVLLQYWYFSKTPHFNPPALHLWRWRRRRANGHFPASKGGPKQKRAVGTNRASRVPKKARVPNQKQRAPNGHAHRVCGTLPHHPSCRVTR
eukprot:5239130-Amphidinium_carterae.2